MFKLTQTDDTAEVKTESRRDLLKVSGEFEMAKNRLIIGTLVAIYLHQSVDHANPMNLQALNIILAYCVMGPIMFAWIIASPAISSVRRLFAMLLDLGTLSSLLYFGGEVASVLYPVYLWVIFGNGFRFGIPFLLPAMGIGAIGFLLVLLYSDYYWANNPHLAAGLMLGVVVLPAYAAKLIRDLNRAKAAAEDASRAKSRFLASISHEFRTPLHAIVGMSDLLLNSPLRKTQQDMVATVRKSAQSLNSLIDTILDFSRLEAGRMPIKSEDFELDKVVINIMQMLKPQAEKKGIAIGVNLDADVPAMVHASRSSLEAVVINLASNAVKFTSEGSVTIASRLVKSAKGTMLVRFEVTDTGIGIEQSAQETIFEAFSQANESILDKFGGTGLGLATAKQLVDTQGGTIGVVSTPGEGTTFWFEIPMTEVSIESEAPEFPGDVPAAIVFTQDGTFVREISEPLAKHGVMIHLAKDMPDLRRLLDMSEDGPKPVVFVDGELVAARTGPMEILAPSETVQILVCESAGELCENDEVRNGFTARVRGPRDDLGLIQALRIGALCQTVRSESDAELSAIPKAQNPSRILVADDNRTNRLVMTQILQAAGHSTVSAEDGESALDAVVDKDIDLVLMDINMPVMNGIEATKHIRVLDVHSGQTTPIIALTADASEEVREKCLQAGMNGCVGKPVDPPYLLNTIDELVASDGTQPEFDPLTAAPVAANDDAVPLRRRSVAIDESAVADLISLGGVGFAREVASEFIGEAQATIERLIRALDRSDMEQLRLQAHALKSSSSNIGAVRLAELCHQDQLPDDDTPVEARADYVGELKAALRAVITSDCFNQLLHEDAQEALAG